MFEDDSCSRLIHFQQLAGTDIVVLKARYEICGFACGIVDNKESVDEDIDIRTRSIGYFTERKINGKSRLPSRILSSIRDIKGKTILMPF